MEAVVQEHLEDLRLPILAVVETNKEGVRKEPLLGACDVCASGEMQALIILKKTRFPASGHSDSCRN